jgi:hypothetical protein
VPWLARKQTSHCLRMDDGEEAAATVNLRCSMEDG